MFVRKRENYQGVESRVWRPWDEDRAHGNIGLKYSDLNESHVRRKSKGKTLASGVVDCIPYVPPRNIALEIFEQNHYCRIGDTKRLYC
jgi:hypothetical protein